MVAPWIPAAVGAGVAGGFGIGGNLIAGIQNKASAKSQERFQKWMYGHRYRLTMKDLKLAGLNPILAAEVGGGGAPSGAGYSFPNVLSEAGAALGDIPERALSYSAKSAEREILNNQVEQSFHEAMTAGSDSSIRASEAKVAEVARRVAQATEANAISAAKASLENTAADTALRRAQERGQAAAAEMTERENEVYESIPALRYIEKVTGAIPRFGIDIRGGQESHRGSDETRAVGGSRKRVSQEYRKTGRSIRLGR